MKNLSEYMLNEVAGRGRSGLRAPGRGTGRSLPNNDITLKCARDDFYEILNALHYYYHNDDDLDRSDKMGIANLFRKLYVFGSDFGFKLIEYGNGDIKKVNFDAGLPDD